MIHIGAQIAVCAERKYITQIIQRSENHRRYTECKYKCYIAGRNAAAVFVQQTKVKAFFCAVMF